MVTPMQQHQEGETARGPNGEMAVFKGGQWVVQSASQPQGWQVQPMQSPSDQRADQRLSLAEDSAARAARNDERRIGMEAQTQDRQGINDESGLRDKFNALPEIREFPVVQSQYNIIRRMTNSSSPAGDLALVTAYMKMLDPGSVVREQEFSNAANAGGAAERAKALISDITGNGILTPKQRADFVAQARSVFEVQATTFNQRLGQYRTLAEGYGFAPDNIGQPVEIPPATPAEKPADPPFVEGDSPAAISAQPVPTEGPGSSEQEPFEITPNTPRELLVNLPKGLWIKTTDENGVTSVNRMAAHAYINEQGAQGDDTLPGGNARLHPTDLGDTARAFTSAAAEQVPFLDEAVVGAQAVLNGEDYSTARDRYRSMQAVDNGANRGARVAGGITGAGLSMVAPGGAVAGRFIGAAPELASGAVNIGGMALRGAMVGAGSGAVYGAGAADGGLKARMIGAGTGAIAGAVTGGALAGGGGAVGAMTAPRAATAPVGRPAQVSMLRDNGVSLTPGQRFGGIVKNVEDLAQRAPILGPAIRGARERGRDSLNRAVGNGALDAIGEGVPANVPVGGDMVGHVADRLGAEFDRAYSLVPQFAPDDQLIQGLTRIGQSKVDLPPATAQQFDAILGDRLSRLGNAPSGAQVGTIRSELQGVASGYLKSPDPAQQGLGRMLAEVSDEMDAAVGRASPEAGEILSRARDGYSDYIRLERASTAAGGRPFTPGQLETAVKASDGSVRRGAVGRGDARMQDLSRAAKDVMPDAFGNPGTADAVGLGALATGAVTAPVPTALAAGGLTAAATPYFLMGRKVLEKLPANASREAVQAAEQELQGLARQDPNVIQLTDELRRLYQGASGAAGGLVSGQATPRLMTGAN